MVVRSFLTVTFQLKGDPNQGSPYLYPPLLLRKKLDILTVSVFYDTWNLGQMCSDQPVLSVAINKSRPVGIVGFRYKPWSKGPGRKHVLRFFQSSRIVRARGRTASTILSLSLLNYQAQGQFLLPSPSPLFMLPLCYNKPPSLFGCNTSGTNLSLEMYHS